jgi:hypothetical protein
MPFSPPSFRFPLRGSPREAGGTYRRGVRNFAYFQTPSVLERAIL